MRLFLGNFEFEYQLRGAAASRPPEVVRRRADELAFSWIAVAEDGDFIWVSADADAGFSDHLVAAGLPRVTGTADVSIVPEDVEISPWGWTDEVREWAGQHQRHVAAPRQSAVREVNSRRFSCQLEQNLNVAPDGITEIHSLAELSAAVSNLPADDDRWVVKAEFSMAARERVLGTGRLLGDYSAAWIRKRIAADGVVFFEPWLERVEEAGLQFEVPPSGEPRLVGMTRLLTTASGAYCGSRICCEPVLRGDWADAVGPAMRALELMQRRGYFGPVGIDAVRYRDARGDIRLRPLMDVNARWTMGRLSLGLRKLLAPGEQATWLHLGASTIQSLGPAVWLEQLQSRMPQSVRTVRTSPLTLGGLPVEHQTLLVIAPSADDLTRAEQAAFETPRPETHWRAE